VDSETPVEVTALQFDKNNGLALGIGTSTGHCLLYDLRAPLPFLIKDHKYEQPIRSIVFHPSQSILSADSKAIKIWDPANVRPSLCYDNS
jgi:ribosome biogenesis protein ENP2